MTALPIDDVLDALRSALRGGSAAVLQAPPGAGKTTRVPLVLRDEPWLRGSSILMLEPRRLAARAAAHRMAWMLGEAVGDTVGYRIRLDARVGRTTRIEVVTEGILTRRLDADPTLDGVGLVIFDEFHERSLHADLGLALTLQAQRLVRPELRILVMSATLDGAAVARLLGGAPVITSEGRQFPVVTRHLEIASGARRDQRRTESAVVTAVSDALRDQPGDLLVFLPGAAEIKRVEARLRELELGPEVTIAPLFGGLSQEDQDRAIRPSAAGRRKIVLATAIAETSLTIEGVRVVVDSGLARVSRFSPRTGMTRLETVRVSRASAEQRCGRAGRLGPGVCLRLWSAVEDRELLPRAAPEILEADLAPLALELAAAGVHDAMELSWLDPPPLAALAQARELLVALDAIDDAHRITYHGRRLATLGLHPRLAHMLVQGAERGVGALACALAALLGERDLLRSEGGMLDVDVRNRLELVQGAGVAPAGSWVDRDALRRVRAEADHLARQLGAGTRGRNRPALAVRPPNVDAAGMLLGLAYPDRIAQRRNARGRYLLRNGRGAAIEASLALADSEYLAIAAVDDRQPDSRVFLAAPITREEIDELFASHIREDRFVGWDTAADAVIARRHTRLGAIVLDDEPLRDPDEAEIATALVDALTREGVSSLPWGDASRRLRERLTFLHETDRSWPDVGDVNLAATLRAWLARRVTGMRSRREIMRIDLSDALLDLLDWRQRGELDELAPTHVVVPSGSRLPIDYADPTAPVLAVRLQEMFGLADTPRIARGRVPLTLHLLSPAQRPVQVTRDLAGFWRTSYFDVKRDLRGRYPKHHWPDDPLTAVPTSRAKPRR